MPDKLQPLLPPLLILESSFTHINPNKSGPAPSGRAHEDTGRSRTGSVRAQEGELQRRPRQRYCTEDKEESCELQDDSKIAAGKQVPTALELKEAKSHEVHLFIQSQNNVT